MSEVTKISGTIYRISNDTIKRMQLLAKSHGTVWAPTGNPMEYKLSVRAGFLPDTAVIYVREGCIDNDTIPAICSLYRKVIIIIQDFITPKSFNQSVDFLRGIDKSVTVLPRLLKECRLDYINGGIIDVFMICNSEAAVKDSRLLSRVNKCFYIHPLLPVEKEIHEYLYNVTA